MTEADFYKANKIKETINKLDELRVCVMSSTYISCCGNGFAKRFYESEDDNSYGCVKRILCDGIANEIKELERKFEEL